MDCLFCKIINGEIPSNKVYEDDDILAFRDIAPQAPVHILFIPKRHIAGADEINADNADNVAKIFTKIPEVAESEGLSGGYRIISNCGPDAAQSVCHLHFHLLGGKKMTEKMC